jgi:hypothetical protein
MHVNCKVLKPSIGHNRIKLKKNRKREKSGFDLMTQLTWKNSLGTVDYLFFNKNNVILFYKKIESLLKSHLNPIA